jgi:hypothetical protein
MIRPTTDNSLLRFILRRVGRWRDCWLKKLMNIPRRSQTIHAGYNERNPMEILGLERKA